MSRTPSIVASCIVVVVAAGGAWAFRGRAPSVVASPAVAASASADPTWCGKPLGARAVGQLRDRSTCTKISLTGTAPSCFFWADCGDLHFEVDCEHGGPGRCRCDGEEGTTVPYQPAFCTLDAERPSAGLRAILDSAATACRWNAK